MFQHLRVKEKPLSFLLVSFSAQPRFWFGFRSVFNQSHKWEEKFTRDVRQDLEKFWKDKVMAQQLNESKSNGKKKFYVLSMFPYPSGKLHMGHVRVYTISDTMARYHRLNGKNVIHPMGWDSFGLPAENAAIERGEKPSDWTFSNIKSMKQQMLDLCCHFDWDREVTTCSPDYYRWTQFIFLKMFNAGLVFQKEAAVNWDPVDLTVLADEQIDENGRSWRSGALVEKKFLKQWYIKTTAYSKSLLDGLDEVNPDLWRDIISLQKNWIGNCDGVRFEFKLQSDSGLDLPDALSVFTKKTEAIYGISHILLSKDHYLNKTSYHKTSSCKNDLTKVVQLSCIAIHPFTGRSIPLFVELERNSDENADAYAGVPSCSSADLEFARLYNLEFTDVVDVEKEVIINSEKFSGLSFKDAVKSVISAAKELKIGGYCTSEKTRDWLISRQRYWGTPIPIIHCKKCGPVPVPYEDLPVVLPEVSTFRCQGASPLSLAEEWLKVKCPKCDREDTGKRETDTMDTFVDSSWYYLRYLDAKNDKEPFSSDVVSKEMPVDLYIGGKEHAILHLYYARFFCHFLYDLGLVPTREPFVNLLTQGMVMGQSYRVKDSGKYLYRHQVEFNGKCPVEKDTGFLVEVQWEKMSKSKYNGVDPQAVLDEFGVDSTRLCILSNVAPKSDRPWSNDVFVGIWRWQSRIWSLVSDFLTQKKSEDDDDDKLKSPLTIEQLKRYDADIRQARNQFLLEVTFHMEKTFLLNTAISRLQGLTNTLKKVPVQAMKDSVEFERALVDLIILIFPFAPMFSNELWSGISSAPHKKTDYNWVDGVDDQSWPVVDDDHRLLMSVKINGKDAFHVRLPMPYTQTQKLLTTEEAFSLVQNHEDYAKNISNRPLLWQQLNVNDNVKVEFDITVEDDKAKKKRITKAS